MASFNKQQYLWIYAIVVDPPPTTHPFGQLSGFGAGCHQKNQLLLELVGQPFNGRLLANPGGAKNCKGEEKQMFDYYEYE
jgi:hypothetical protein